jgi:hypothetical protein
MKWVFTIATAAVLMAGGTARAQYQQPDTPHILDVWSQHYLGHPTDRGAVDYWAPQFAQVGPQEVLARILSGREYFDRNGDTPDGLVLGLYRDVLGRSPAQLRPQDVDYWVNKMRQYGSAEAMIAEFLHDANTDIFNPPAAPAPAYQPPAQPYAPPAYTPPAQQYTPPAYAPFTYTPPAYTQPYQRYTVPAPRRWRWYPERR